MELVTQIQILGEAVCISLGVKETNPSVLYPVAGKWSVRLSPLALVKQPVQEKGKWIQTGFTLLKNWPCVTSWQKFWINANIFTASFRYFLTSFIQLNNSIRSEVFIFSAKKNSKCFAVYVNIFIRFMAADIFVITSHTHSLNIKAVLAVIRNIT